MSAFRGILTGYGIAAIKNKEAKDNAKMEVIKSAGIDFFENKVPQHEKEMKLYEKDFNAVALVHGEDIANLFGDADAGFYGTGKGLDLVNGVIKQKKIDKERLKNFKFSSQEDRISKKKSAFQKKSDQMKNLTGIGGMGPGTVENQLEGFGETETSDGTTIPAPVDMGTMEKEVEGTSDTTQDISTLFSDRPDERGVESKYSQVVKSIEEQNGYADTMSIGADGQANFTWGPKRKIAAAHAQFATMLLDKDKTLDQNTAASAAKKYLVFYTEKPFKELETIPELKGSVYQPGDGIKSIYSNAGKIDINSVKYKDISIKDYILDKIDNLPTTRGGNINEAIFQKFVENVPENLMDGEITFRSSLLAQRQTQELTNNYFSLNN
tara:strand:+ start:74 stop:1216 length:1143 start_codon:yes stop_codon:yes gene_type:complete